MNRNFRFEQERDSEFRIRKQELVEYILNKGYGQVITIQEISGILHVNAEIDDEIVRIKNIVGSVKNYLIQNGRVLKSIKDVGYYILKPSQVSGYCYRTYVKGSMRMLDKSEFILDRTDKTELNQDRTEEINNMIKLNKNLIDNMWKTVKESGYYNRKAYYDSLEEK